VGESESLELLRTKLTMDNDYVVNFLIALFPINAVSIMPI